VCILHGNRDFLISNRFLDATGCELIQQNTIIDLYGTPTLLCHGDSLCTDDADHQKFRKLVLSDAWQADFLAKPFEERVAIAKNLRDQSREETRKKPEAITDVNQQTVENIMRENNVLQMIHGHTHRPAIHEFSIDGKPARRIVLGDWDEKGSLLRVDKTGCQLESFALQANKMTENV
jgi:UDP-2,3-diacylglucosamine hydrolase